MKTWTQSDFYIVAALEAEVSPPGAEHIVKKLKQKPGVENPWAVAWSMKKKGVASEVRPLEPQDEEKIKDELEDRVEDYDAYAKSKAKGGKPEKKKMDLNVTPY